MSTRRKRTIHIDDREWRFVIAHHKIEIRDLDNHKWLIDVCDLPGNEGWTSELIERARWKGNSMPPITPGAVKHYIETKILGKILPDYVQRHDDKDEGQEAVNAKHWLRARHRVLRYTIALCYGAGGDFERVDGEPQERQDAVPLEVIRETLVGLKRTPAILHFTLDTRGHTERDNSVIVMPRHESGKDVYVIYSRVYGGVSGDGYADLIHVPKALVVT
jgi:hypothetical protein